jgi:hypothetical protein
MEFPLVNTAILSNPITEILLFSTVKTHIVVLSGMTPCSLVVRYQRF